MEQFSNILVYARDCDVHVLEDLYAWLKRVTIDKNRIPGLKYSSAQKTIALVKKLLISKLDSQINYACGGNNRRMQ